MTDESIRRSLSTFCNECKDLFCKDVYFSLLLCIMFCHNNIYCMFVELTSKYKTVHNRNESEKQHFVELRFSFSAYSVLYEEYTTTQSGH